jgi:CpeT protein
MKKLLLITLLLVSNLSFGQMTEKNLRDYTKRITGVFSTEEQHISDSTFDNVRVYTKLIRKDINGIYWVYTEQGEFKNYKPYRQRVYQLSIVDGKILQRIYYIKNESNFSYFNPKTIKSITINDIYIKPGCDLQITYVAYPILKNVYGGTTNDTNCVATFRGSSYTTTDFKVYETAVHSWERGWDKNGKQVWGSSKGHYIYKKISK